MPEFLIAPIIRPTCGSRYQIRRCGRATFLRREVECARGSHAIFFEQSKTPGYAQSRLSLSERVRFRAGRDRARVVAGLSEGGRCRYAGVTDPGYNCRCYLALNHAAFRADAGRELRIAPIRRSAHARLWPDWRTLAKAIDIGRAPAEPSHRPATWTSIPSRSGKYTRLSSRWGLSPAAFSFSSA
jgi:hypothetical protein